MSLNTIFIIGPQGSGKGTQGKLLAARLGFFSWDTGAICRETATLGTPLGRQVKDMIENGVLLPDDVLLKVVETKLADIRPEQGIIFDGVPRRLGQAEWLMQFLKGQGRASFTTLFLDVPREESVARLTERAAKEGRVDDTREKIEFRLKQYEEATVPVLDYLKTCTSFVSVKGLGSIPEVTARINGALGVA